MSTKIDNILKKLEEFKLDAYIIPSNDEFFNEYTPAFLKRLQYLTNFSGSNGYAVIMKNQKHVFFTDGRYLLQAKSELPNNFKVFEINSPSFKKWWHQLDNNILIGYDPKLHSSLNLKTLNNLIHGPQENFKPIEENLVDQIWSDRPQENQEAAFLLPFKYAGLSSHDKLAMLRSKFDTEANYLLLTKLDSICWLLNIRGSDIDYTPFLLAYMLFSKQGEIILFANFDQVPHFELSAPFSLKIIERENILTYLKNISKEGMILQTDFAKSPIWLQQNFPSHQLINKADPIELQKACKNKTEIQGFHDCHLQDGIALMKFLSWLWNNVGKIDEINAAKALLSFRQERDLFQYPSFETISAYGENAAIIHYHAKPATNKLIGTDNLYLLDSGGQYLNGTTDITRTLYLGKDPDPIIKKYYTLVLKGHIAIASLKFPKGTTGSQIDVLARQPLWKYGHDYAHGTGHGVGHFLSVHEGPVQISKNFNSTPLEVGMVLSNEPGFYLENKFGIRIENLYVVKESKYKNYYEFENLTLVPIQTSLINYKLLNRSEKKWLLNYNEKVKGTLSSYLTKEENEFVKYFCS